MLPGTPSAISGLPYIRQASAMLCPEASVLVIPSASPHLALYSDTTFSTEVRPRIHTCRRGCSLASRWFMCCSRQSPGQTGTQQVPLWSLGSNTVHLSVFFPLTHLPTGHVT